MRDIARIDFHPAVTFFTGENGTGKSTVLEAIALALALGYNAEGGSSHAHFQTAGDSDGLRLRLIRSPPNPGTATFSAPKATSTSSATTAKSATPATTTAAGCMATRTAKPSSSFFCTALTATASTSSTNRKPRSPPPANSPYCALDRLVQNHSQLIIATHSPILLSYPHARIIRFDADGVQTIAYEDSDVYRLTRDFLNHHPHRLAQLLADTDV